MSLRFEIESKGETKKSPSLSTPEICIYLNRYGLVNKTEGTTGAEVFPDNSLSHQINHYAYCRRYLRNGYVYIYNQTKDWIDEYEVKDGKYYEILKYRKVATIQETTLPDKRLSDQNTLNKFYITEKQESVLWIIYSHVQWSTKYMIEYIKNENSFRTIRGQKYDTKQFIAKDAGYIGATKIYFKPLSKIEEKDLGNPNSELRNEYRYTEILAEESYRKVEDATQKMKEEHKKFMVTFSLHDPIGCADDVADDYARQTEYHTALTQGLPYAKTPEEMLANKNNPSFLDIYSKESLQYYALYQSASLLNEMILKNPPSNHNDGFRLNREWIQKVLALKERKESFEQMIKTHMTLGIILSSNYYQNALIDIYTTSFEELARGQVTVLTHHRLLAFAPNHVENSFGQEYYRTFWNDYMYHSFYYGGSTPKDPIVRKEGDLQYVVRELFNIDFRETSLFPDISKNIPGAVGWANSFVLNVDATLGLYSFFLKAQQDKQQYLSRIESVTNMKKGTIQQAKHELDVLLDKLNSELDDKAAKFIKNVKWYERIFSPNRKLSELEDILTETVEKNQTKRTQIIELANEKTLEYNERLRILNEENERLEKKLKGVAWLDSRIYKRILTTLSVTNLIFATKENYAKGFNLKIKSVMNEIGYITETSSVVLAVSLSEAQNEYALREWFGAKNFKFTLAARVGVVATCVLSVSTIWDGINLYNQRDYAAGGFYIASGITGFASGIVIWQSYASSAAFLGPWGWGLIIASFVLLMIGSYLKKSDWAKFLEYSVFGNRSDNKKADLAGETPTGMMRWLYNNGKPNARVLETTKDESYDLKNFRDMLRYLFDEISYFEYRIEPKNYWSNGDWNIITRFDLTFKFREVLSFAKLEFLMGVSYHSGGSIAYIEPVGGSPKIETTEDGFINVRFIFDLSYPPAQVVSSDVRFVEVDGKLRSQSLPQTTDHSKNQIAIQNLGHPSSPNGSEFDLRNGVPKIYRFVFRITDKDENMSLPLSPDLHNPLYYVIDGNLYSPYINTNGLQYVNIPGIKRIDPNCTYPQTSCAKKTKNELSL